MPAHVPGTAVWHHLDGSEDNKRGDDEGGYAADFELSGDGCQSIAASAAGTCHPHPAHSSAGKTGHVRQSHRGIRPDPVCAHGSAWRPGSTRYRNAVPLWARGPEDPITPHSGLLPRERLLYWFNGIPMHVALQSIFAGLSFPMVEFPTQPNDVFCDRHDAKE